MTTWEEAEAASAARFGGRVLTRAIAALVTDARAGKYQPTVLEELQGKYRPDRVALNVWDYNLLPASGRMGRGLRNGPLQDAMLRAVQRGGGERWWSEGLDRKHRPDVDPTPAVVVAIARMAVDGYLHGTEYPDDATDPEMPDGESIPGLVLAWRFGAREAAQT